MSSAFITLAYLQRSPLVVLRFKFLLRCLENSKVLSCLFQVGFSCVLISSHRLKFSIIKTMPRMS